MGFYDVNHSLKCLGSRWKIVIRMTVSVIEVENIDIVGIRQWRVLKHLFTKSKITGVQKRSEVALKKMYHLIKNAGLKPFLTCTCWW